MSSLFDESNNNNTGDNADNQVLVELTAEQIEEQAIQLRAGLEDLFDHVRMSMAMDGILVPGMPTATTSSEESIQEQFMMLISQYSEQALERACLMTSSSDDHVSSSQRLPIHLACEYSAPVPVISYLLNSDKNKLSIKSKDKWGDLPIHIACSRSNYGAVVKLLLDSDIQKETIKVKDCNEYMPIHMACRYLATPAVKLLLEADTTKSTLFEEGIHGQYPIHIGCRSDAPPEIIQLLLEADDQLQSVLKEDDGGRLPIHVYLVRHRNMQVASYLLKTMICGRMDRLGLEHWKGNMYSLCKSLSGTYERDFMTREKLDVISLAIKDFMERAFLLELAVWRASCLMGMKDSLIAAEQPQQQPTFTTMLDIEELGRNDPNFDPSEYKQARRIKSGAEVIVRDVLPFLEGEPIEQILQQLKEMKYIY